MEMPWGKYKGKDIKEIPASYLGFVLEDCDGLKDHLRQEVKNEIRRRFLIGMCVCCFSKATVCGACAQNTQSANPTKTNLPNDWLRKMSKRFHPDRGGSTDAMAAVNEGVLILKELMGN